MSWGTELWDQYDNLSIHTNKGIEFLDKYGNFIRERSAIETEYAGKLRRLVKNYQPKKKEGGEDNEFTTWQAFRNVLKEVTDLAGQREVIAESLQQHVVQGITLLSKALRDERKKALNDGATLQHNLNAQLGSLDRAKRNYEKAYRDSEKAIDNHKKADADYNLSRAEVERYKNIMTMKIQQSDDAKNEYANQLQKTNNLQQQHYNVLLPAVFNRLQELDEKRTRGLREFIIGAADTESSVATIIASCLDGMMKAGESINEKEDSLKVIERYQSGFTPPNDIPFEDLSKLDPDAQTDDFNVSASSNHLTMKGTISANKLKKRVGIFGLFGSNKNSLIPDGKDDFSDLPPNQQRKKLQAKVAELQTKLQQETNARDALMKMKLVYETNSSMGNPMIVEGQLNESEHKIEKLRQDVSKYQGYLDRVLQQQMINQSPQTQNRTNHQQNQNHHQQSQQLQQQNGHNRNSRHSSNGSNAIDDDQQHGDDGEDQPDDARSFSRSDSEDNVAQNLEPNGHIHNNNNSNNNKNSNSKNNNSSSNSNSNINVNSNSNGYTPMSLFSYVSTKPTDNNIILQLTQQHQQQLQLQLQQQQLGQQLNNHQQNTSTSSASPESGIGTSHTSLPGSRHSGAKEPGQGQGVSEEAYFDAELESLPALGVCRALYTFEADNPGSIPMTEGEELEVIEIDQGDGWTRVRRMNVPEHSRDEGFVPTTYIDYTLYA